MDDLETIAFALADAIDELMGIVLQIADDALPDELVHPAIDAVSHAKAAIARLKALVDTMSPPTSQEDS